MNSATLFLLLALVPPVLASDEFSELTAFLETNGVMADRARAFQGRCVSKRKSTIPQSPAGDNLLRDANGESMIVQVRLSERRELIFFNSLPSGVVPGRE